MLKTEIVRLNKKGEGKMPINEKRKCVVNGCDGTIEFYVKIPIGRNRSITFCRCNKCKLAYFP